MEDHLLGACALGVKGLGRAKTLRSFTKSPAAVLAHRGIIPLLLLTRNTSGKRSSARIWRGEPNAHWPHVHAKGLSLETWEGPWDLSAQLSVDQAVSVIPLASTGESTRCQPLRQAAWRLSSANASQPLRAAPPCCYQRAFSLKARECRPTEEVKIPLAETPPAQPLPECINLTSKEVCVVLHVGSAAPPCCCQRAFSLRG
jgi:hypothetical protein